MAIKTIPKEDSVEAFKKNAEDLKKLTDSLLVNISNFDKPSMHPVHWARLNDVMRHLKFNQERLVEAVEYIEEEKDE